MNETQIIQGVRKMLDVCFASGLIKTLEEAQYAVTMFQSLVARFTPPVQTPVKKENDNQ